MDFVHHRPFAALTCLFTLFLVSGCDEGLAPDAVKVIPYGIKGTIYFRNWPPRDSIIDLCLGALSNYPVTSIIEEVTSKRASITPTLAPFFADSIPYILYLPPLPPGAIPFIGVAQQFGQNLYTDWRIVGIYYAGGDTSRPGSVLVPPDSIVEGINITVDFAHPPSINPP